MKIIFAGPFFSASGYGKRSLDIVQSLYKLYSDDKIEDIKFIKLKWGNTPQIDLLKLDRVFYDFIKDNILYEDYTEENLECDILLHCGMPTDWVLNTTGKYIGITAGIETNMAPAELLDACNKMDKVLFSSDFSKKVFEITEWKHIEDEEEKLIKLTVPADVLVEGIDDTVFSNYIPEYFKIKNNNEVIKELDKLPEEKIFLFSGMWLNGTFMNDRKNISGLVYTFLSLFKQARFTKKPALILKSNMIDYSEIDLHEIATRVETIRKMIELNEGEEFPNIYIFHGEISDSDMNILYNHSKIIAMVSFTHGEGFGRPLAEFAFTGKPIIVSGWSGHTDFLDEKYSLMVGGELGLVDQSVANNFIAKKAKWFNINLNDAAKYLSIIIEDKVYDDMLEKTKNQRKIMLEKFTLKKMTNDLFKQLTDILK